MTEPTINCPKCKTEIKLIESLAAPLIESPASSSSSSWRRKTAKK